MKYNDPHRRPYEHKGKKTLRVNVGDWVVHKSFKKTPRPTWQILEVKKTDTPHFYSDDYMVCYFSYDVIFNVTDEEEGLGNTKDYFKVKNMDRKYFMEKIRGEVVGRKVGIL